MSDEVELKPCPFCGGEGEIQIHNSTPAISRTFSVECQICFCSTFQYGFKTKCDAINHWNMRKSSPQPSETNGSVNEKDLENLREYVIAQGSIHAMGCPCDDTCDCKFKPILESVNKICRAKFGTPALVGLDINTNELTKEWEESFYDSGWHVNTTHFTKTEQKIVDEITSFLPRHMPVYDWNLPYAEKIILILRRHLSKLSRFKALDSLNEKELFDFMWSRVSKFFTNNELQILSNEICKTFGSPAKRLDTEKIEALANIAINGIRAFASYGREASLTAADNITDTHLNRAHAALKALKLLLTQEEGKC